MLDYAARRPVVAARPSSPNAMLIVVSAHIAVLAAVMSAKMDLPQRIATTTTIVDFLPADPPPVEPERPTEPDQGAGEPNLAASPRIVPTPPTSLEIANASPVLPDMRDLIGSPPGPAIDPAPRSAPVSVAAQLLTPAALLKPPYPQSKLLSEEEAVLKLRLTIGADGRVTAVEPAARANPEFLDAARRHILAHWRYRPASEGGRAVGSSVLITLRFQLDS